MKWIQKFNLFLLDFDGLLVNTEAIHYKAYCILCQRKGFPLSWSLNDYCFVAHTSSADVIEDIYSLYPKLREKEPVREMLYAEKKQIYIELLSEGKVALMPGVEAFLKELSRFQVKRCVVTHSPHEQISFIRNTIPVLDSIPVWITRERYKKPKPAPDAYLAALELLADPGDRVLGFEDSLRGILALKGANVPQVLICDKDHRQLQNPALFGIRHYPTFEAIPTNVIL